MSEHDRSSLELLEWKPPKGDKNGKKWNDFCESIARMIKEIPSGDPAEYAIITRTPDSEASKGEVVRTSEPKDLVALAVDADTEFAAKWFMAYEKKIAVLLTILAGERRGTHFLLGPNKFPDDMQNHLNFMRSMEKASDNSGA